MEPYAAAACAAAAGPGCRTVLQGLLLCTLRLTELETRLLMLMLKVNYNDLIEYLNAQHRHPLLTRAPFDQHEERVQHAGVQSWP
jgi:hypothetical protein